MHPHLPGLRHVPMPSPGMHGGDLDIEGACAVAIVVLAFAIVIYLIRKAMHRDDDEWPGATV